MNVFARYYVCSQKSYSLLFLISICFFLSACIDTGSDSKSDNAADGGDQSVPQQTTAVLTQYTDPADSLMLGAETESGEKLFYYAKKDSEGVPTNLDSVRYQTTKQAGTNAATWLHFADSGQLARIEDDSGTVIDIEQISETEFALAVVSGDGKIQANTVANLDDSVSAMTTIAKSITAQGVPAQMGEVVPSNLGNVVKNYAGALALEDSGGLVRAVNSDNTASVQASVIQCGNGQAVEDASVFFSASNPGDPAPPTFLAEHIGNGRYKASIPLGNTPLTADAVKQACTGVANTLSVSCESTSSMRQGGSGLFCGAVSVAIDSLLGGPSGEGALIFSECQAGFLGLAAYCNTVSATPTGLPGPTDYICDNIATAVSEHPGVQAAVDLNQLEVQAYVNVPGRGRMTSDAVTLNPFTEEYPSFVVDYGGSIAIQNISASPSAPLKGQGYSLTTELACSAGSAVTIEVSGSDGFSSRHTFSPSDDVPLTVDVSGSTEERDRDVVKVLAVSPEVGLFGLITTASRDMVVVFREEESDDTASPPIATGDFDFGLVTRGSFELKVDANGTFFDGDGSSQPAFRSLLESESFPLFTPPVGTGCPGIGFDLFGFFGFPFEFSENAVEALSGQRRIGGVVILVDSETCMTASSIHIQFQSNDNTGISGKIFKDIDIDLEEVSVQAEVLSDELLVYRISGQTLCNSFDDFDLFLRETTGSFSTETPFCDSDSVLEVRLER